MSKKFLIFLSVINLSLSLICFTVLAIQNEHLAEHNIVNSRRTQQLIDDNKRMREEIYLYKTWCTDMVNAIEQEKL